MSNHQAAEISGNWPKTRFKGCSCYRFPILYSLFTNRHDVPPKMGDNQRFPFP